MITHRLKQYFFSIEDVVHINRFRFLFCSILSFVHLTQMIRIQNLYENFFALYLAIPAFKHLGLGLPDKTLVVVAGVVLLCCLILSALGLLTRYALTLSLPLFLFFYGTLLGFEKPSPYSSYVYHYNNINFFILLVLAAAPGIHAYRLSDHFSFINLRARPQHTRESTYTWVRHTIVLLLGIAYFGAGYSKLATSGIGWLGATNLQTYILMKTMQEGSLLGYWLAHQDALCAALSVGTLLFELGFVFVVPFTRVKWLRTAFILSGIGFHMGIALSMNILHFLPFMMLSYLIFIGYTGVRDAHEPVRSYPQWLQMSFSSGLIGLAICCVFLRVEYWPFSDFGVFINKVHYGDIEVYKYAGIRHNGDRDMIPPTNMGPGCHGWYDCGDPKKHLFKLYPSTYMMEPENDEKRQHFFNAVEQNLADKLKKHYKTLEVVRLTVRRQNKQFQVVTTPVWRHDMLARRAQQ